MLLVALVVGLAVLGLVIYKQYSRSRVSTDDAFVDGRIHTVAARISGTIKAVHVADNQPVKRGDLLVEIDPEDYDLRVDEAGADLDSERAKLEEAAARVAVATGQLEQAAVELETARINMDVQKKNLIQSEGEIRRSQAAHEGQEARVRQADKDYKRSADLFKRELISREAMENVHTARDVAVAQTKVTAEQLTQSRAAREVQADRVLQASSDVRRAEKALETQKHVVRQAETARHTQGSLIKQKEATFRTARLNRSYARVCAPADGYVTKRSAEVGNTTQPGLALMAVVPLTDTWIVANYKETQLERVRPGQRVKITIDGYPGKTFEGTVESIMAGTGSAFSLFPPENATGNFVKVVQRVPVKIVLKEGADPEHLLRVGMSVVPTVFTR